jgi:hypothetical protein
MKQTAGGIQKIGTKEFNNLAMEMFGGKPKQQTAVEWLAHQMEHPHIFNPLIEKALEMEKQQIIDAYIDGYSAESWNADSQKYYNETFNK